MKTLYLYENTIFYMKTLYFISKHYILYQNTIFYIKTLYFMSKHYILYSLEFTGHRFLHIYVLHI